MIVILAMLIDRCFGEPTASLHPVVWMGRYLKRFGDPLPSYSPRVSLLLGGTFWFAGAVVVAAIFWLVSVALSRLPLWLEISIAALMLKPLFAFRMLLSEVAAVEAALAQGLEAGRARLAMIVSRNTASLDETEVRESAMESLSENLSDSVVAPLFWFVLLGLPGAAVYRFANTADAMWGYRGRWEWAGKVAARADDILNWIPARLTAIALLCSAGELPRGISLLQTEAARTASPNSGWPMAALALALNVRLRKPGVYTLNGSGAAPTASDMERALRIVARTAWSVAILMGLAQELVGRYFHV